VKVPLSWLKEYVDIVVPVKELAHRITMAGTEVAEVATIGGWKDCFVGYVTGVEQHPNADRLTLCTVDIGSERVQVVCGAPNVAAKQKIAFAKVGAGLFNAHSGKVEALKAARIRGVVSEGMICSERELGTGDDHTGILVLPDDAPVGTPLSDYLGDYILDLEVTPNRPDCLSMLGVAHEAATLTGATVREPDCSYPEEGPPIETAASVEIADPDLCHRYTASMITGIKVGPSPRWLQDRLLKAGMRPINNVVDITNYVMLEYNQPLHAFDFDTLREGKVVVRRARPGEVLVSLDGVERSLSPSMLVIADARDAAALGGVIGSAHTEMTETTTTVLLESATFSPVNNRRTAQALRISTEASTRFEKGLRPELAPIALRRATQLIHQIAGGVVFRGILDVFPARDQYAVPTLTLTMGRLRKVLGIDLPIKRVEQALVSLGFLCDSLNGNALRVTVPYWRSDINIEDDLVEEVARVIGYEEIPTTMLSTPIPQYQPDPMQELKENVKDLLAACEMQEVITYSLTSLEGLQKVKALDSGVMPLKLANPMSDQQQYLRTTLRNSLLSTLAANRLHDQGPLAIFELGRIYLPRERDSQESGGLPEEREVAAGVLAGPQWDALKLSPGEEGHLGFYDAKGVVEKVLEELGVTAIYEPAQDPALHPGKCARVVAGDATLGVIGEIHPVVVEAFEIERGPVALFELDVENLLAATSQDVRRYSPVSRFPSATRDLSLVLDLNVPAARVQEVIMRQRLVDRVALFDVYSGKNVPAGKRSLAYHVYFQAPDRTLTTEEVNRASQNVLKALEREVGAELRE
jgi:phenylalanyl-tRNA synthetase beta chain